MATSILYEVNGELELVLFDATVTELHALSATATEHPVERGVSLTDHVRIERARLSIEAHVTNTPIVAHGADGAIGEYGALSLTSESRSLTKSATTQRRSEFATTKRTSGANVLQFADRFDRVGAVWSTLAELMRNGTGVTVVTPLKQYEQMVITDLSAPRDVTNSNAVMFSIELVEIRYGESQTVDAPEPVESRARRSTNSGSQSTEPSTTQAAAANESLWYRLSSGDGSVMNLFSDPRPSGRVVQ